jgi:hypothetical protein
MEQHMSSTLSRKQFLRTGTKVAAGVAVGATVLGSIEGKHLGASVKYPEWPWAYAAMDVERVRILGHDSYWSGKGCSYGAFHALMEELRTVIGDPFTGFPDEIMIYGHGGGAGWGATCGAINGAAALISLVTTKAVADKLNSELYGWYTQAELPTATSNQYAVEQRYGVNKINEALLQNIAGSPLCHVSVALWCDESKYKVGTTERKERCGRITGDCAAYAAQLLNDELTGQFNPFYTVPPEVAACQACHGSGMLDNVVTKMECQACHGDPHTTGGIRQTGELALNYELSANYPNPFNPSTKLSFSIPRGENVFLQIFDSHGRLVSTIVNGTHMNPGSYEFTWDAANNAVMPLSSGTYYVRLVAGKFVQTRKMMLMK